jgi:hypothetical protein
VGPDGVPEAPQRGHRVMASRTHANGSRGRRQHTMALDESALLEVLSMKKPQVRAGSLGLSWGAALDVQLT